MLQDYVEIVTNCNSEDCSQGLQLAGLSNE